MTDKAKSDKLGLGLVLIPFHSIYRIGAIFIEGLRYGRDNWRKGIGDKEYQEERLEHALNHLFLYKEGDTSEDHLAKVAWFCVTQMEILRQERMLEMKQPASGTVVAYKDKFDIPIGVMQNPSKVIAEGIIKDGIQVGIKFND